MLLSKFNFILIILLGFVEQKLYLDQIVNFDGLFYKKSDQKLVNGKVYLNKDEGDKFLGKIVKGEKKGLWLDFYSNGKKKGEYTYKNGMMNGPYTLWFKNGVRGEYGFYKDNKKDRLIIKWDQNGKKYSSVTFKDGYYHGKIIFYKTNGKIKYEGIYREGKCIQGIKKGFRHKGKFPNPVYEVYEDNKLVKLKWLDKDDRITEIYDCTKQDCN